MYAHFELDGELGLDEDRDPIPSFVVSTAKKRRIQVWGNPGSWKVETDDDTVATARVTRSLGNAADIEIRGVSTGTAEIHAHHGRMSAKLFVRVVNPRDVSVNFHFFTSGPSTTQINRAQAVALLGNINKIYEQQSFVNFRIHRMVPIQEDELLKLDFATTSQSKAKENKIWKALQDYLDSNYPTKSHRNVFLVKKWGARDRWSCGKDCSYRDVMGTNPIGGNVAIVESHFHNAASRLPQLLAHELGHSLGLKHKTALEKNLMQPTVNVANIRITERQARKITSSA